MKTHRLIWAGCAVVMAGILYVGGFVIFNRAHGRIVKFDGDPALKTLTVPDTLGYRALAVVYAPVFWYAQVEVRFFAKKG